MKLKCVPSDYPEAMSPDDSTVLLYGRTEEASVGTIGEKISTIIRNKKLLPSQRAWDFLSIALSIIAADHGAKRSISPDGWTREFDLQIAVHDPEFWETQSYLLQTMLCFLTTDIWKIGFLPHGSQVPIPKRIWAPDRDSVILLSGGLDSLIGAIDLVSLGHEPFAISQMVSADGPKQRNFAQCLGLSNFHLQLNHCVDMPNPETPPTDRARSIIFMAYGILLASCLAAYHEGQNINLVVAENGLISLNPPLTAGRIGSLSTRTTHPHFMQLMQNLLDAAELRVQVKKPYQFYTKGEMLQKCQDQELLKRLASSSTSCGKFGRPKMHCGRCLPCLIRRASFQAWLGQDNDDTEYKFKDLSIQTKQYARFDDVQSAALAVLKVNSDGLDDWLGGTLNSEQIGNVQPYTDVIRKGMDELGNFLCHSGVI